MGPRPGPRLSSAGPAICPPDTPFPRPWLPRLPRQGTPRPCFLGAARGGWLPLRGPLMGAVLPLAPSLPGGLSRPPTPASPSPVTPAPSSLGPCTLLTPSEPPPAECRAEPGDTQDLAVRGKFLGVPAPFQTAATPTALWVLAEAMLELVSLPLSVRTVCPSSHTLVALSWRLLASVWPFPSSRVAPAGPGAGSRAGEQDGPPLPTSASRQGRWDPPGEDARVPAPITAAGGEAAP